MNPYRWIKDNNINFGRLDFESIEGICSQVGNRGYICVRNGMDAVQEREVIAHEIGHFLTGTTDNIYRDKYIEKLADEAGANFLISKEEIVNHIEENEGICDAQHLSQIFGVSLPYMMNFIKVSLRDA